MLLISIDTETTGLDSEKCQILEFGAILEDTNNQLTFDEIPKFNCIIERKEIVGEVFAIDMNKDIINILKQYSCLKGEEKEAFKKLHNILQEHQLVSSFDKWIKTEIEKINPNLDNSKLTINVAGKNFSSFDEKFLNKLPGWNRDIRIRHRVIDPSVLYVDWSKDECLPSLDECLKRAGIRKTVNHRAVEDAFDVIQVLRNKY